MLQKLIKQVDNYEWEGYREKFMYLGSNYRISKPYSLHNVQYISIGNNFSSLYNLRLEAFDEYYGELFSPQIIIGNNVSINSDCHIGCINKITIGDNVLIASKVYISDHNHGSISSIDRGIAPYLRPLSSKGAIIIEENVWIGEGVCILSGVTIGENSIVGANSVVNKNIPANCVVAGAPAKIIKKI